MVELDLKTKQYLATEHFWAKKLPTGWRFEVIEDLITDTVDNRGRTVPTSDSGIPLIATNCISNDSLYPQFKDIRYVSQEIHDEWFRDGHSKPNDIIFVNKGSPGQVCLVPSPVNFCFAQDMIALKINNKKIDFRYLLAVLRTKFMQEQIFAFHVGTLIPHLKKADFDSIIIPIPPKKLEKFIGVYYITISKKIDNLQNQNKVLEQIAQAIFKSWFVDFDGQTEFEDSELGEIPKGWTINPIGKILELAYGKSLTENKRKSGKVPVFGSSGIVGYHNESLSGGPGIIVGRKGNVGAVYWSAPAFYPIDTVFYVKTDFSLHYIYQNFQNQNFLNSDSSVPGLQRELAYTLPMLIPDKPILEKFDKHSKIIRILIDNNNNSIEILLNIRDSLLPKLMSGKIRV